MTIRVAITAPTGRTGGIARYGWRLIEALADRDDVELVPIGDRTALRDLDALGPGIRVPSETAAQALAVQHGIAGALVRHRVDVVHGLKHVLPERRGPAAVLTAHDDFLFTRPGDYGWAKRTLLPRVYRSALRRADQVLAVSDLTARSIERLDLGCDVRTVRHPFETDLGAAPSIPVAGLSDLTPFALHVGEWLARKNLPLLLSAWPAVHAATGATLVLAGPDRGPDDVVAAVHDAAVDGSVLPLGRVSDGQLRWLYANARVTCVSSTEEGWGLPVTESLSLGTPVVATTHPALVEAAGGAATHLPADDPAAWTQALIERLGAPKVAPPPSRDRGRTWATVAAEVATSYHQVAAGA